MIAQATRAFTNGIAAYDSGEYAIAQEVWRPLKHSGDPAAQPNLAHFYRMGLGMVQDFVQAQYACRRKNGHKQGTARVSQCCASSNQGVRRIEFS